VIVLDFKAAKRLFVDRKAVRRDVDRTTVKALASAGGWIRTTARRSIRSVPAAKRFTAPPSSPGKPPRSRGGQLKRFLFFAYDPSEKSVVVGPARLPRGDGAPSTLEFGGTSRNDRRPPRPRRAGEVGEIAVVGAASASKPGVRPARDAFGRTIPGRFVQYATLRTPRMAARANRIRGQLRAGASRTSRVAPRPYMAPALERALARDVIPAAFRRRAGVAG